MTASRKNSGGGNVNLTVAKRKNSSNVFVDCAKGYRRTASGTWTQIWPNTPLSISVAPIYAEGFGPGQATEDVYTNGVVVTASGGTGSYTYTWSRIGPLNAITNVNALSSASQYWRALLVPSSSVMGTWRCTVSDGVNTAFVNVSVYIYNGLF